LALQAQLSTTLSPKTTAAFESYLRQAEPKMTNTPRYPQLRAGEVRIDPAREDGSIGVNDGMVHDWVAATVAPGATVEQALAVLQNYAAYKTVYQPEIVDSRLIARNGDEWRVYLKIVKKKVLTAVLNSEYDVMYRPLGNGRWAMSSRSTRIAEVDDGKELPLGTGHGFLWRLNAYWLMEQRPNGVYLECRSISLSRSIPFGLGFAVGPFVKSLPRESLQSTMEATARALGHTINASTGSEHPTIAQNEIDERRQRNRR
jgi:hypothetical protein